ncbi:MAG: phosphate ABC transporter permease subunit PstC [Isosphaeraceae bacterium]
MKDISGNSILWKSRRKSVKIQERLAFAVLLFFTLITVFTTFGIVAVLSIETLRFFQVADTTPIEFLTNLKIQPEAEKPIFGILPLAWGTFVITCGSCLIAIPIGLSSAIYLSEFASPRSRAILKPSLELLAGVPTIVYGYLALLLVTPALNWIMLKFGIKVDTYNAASAAVVVGIMIIPMVSSLSEDVIRAVPSGLREAGYGLGATRFEVITRIVIPAGLSGIMASFILAFSRAIGETMAVVLAAGQLPQISSNICNTSPK